MSDVVVATFTAFYSEEGQLIAGQLYAADHPLVQEHPDWFSDDLSTFAVQAPQAVPLRSDGYETIDDVLGRVGGDPELAQEELDAELESEKPRSTLVDKLQAIIGTE